MHVLPCPVSYGFLSLIILFIHFKSQLQPSLPSLLPVPSSPLHSLPPSVFIVCQWRSEDNIIGIRFLFHVGLGDQIQVTRPFRQFRHVLCHLTGPVWFWGRMSLISLGWLRTYCSVQNCLELPIFLPQPPECWDYRCLQHLPLRPGFDVHCACKLFITVKDKPV